MAGKSQAEAVNTLRSTRGLVTLLVQREEVVQPSRTHAIEVSIKEQSQFSTSIAFLYILIYFKRVKKRKIVFA